jgi:hypothetical protein
MLRLPGLGRTQGLGRLPRRWGSGAGTPTTASAAFPAASGAGSISATQSAALAPADRWGAVIDQADQSAKQAAQLGLYAARGVNPDDAGRAMAIGQQMGVPAPAVAADLPAWQQRLQAAQNGATLARDPVLAEWLAANPLAPPVAHDDLQNLSMVGQLAREWSSGWSSAVTGNQLARLAYAGNANPAQVASLEASLKAATTPETAGLVHGVAGLVGGLADMLERAAPVGVAGAIGGGAIGAAAAGLPSGGTLLPVGAGAGAAVGAGAGFTAGLFADAFKVGAGNIFRELDQVRDAGGNPVDPTVKLGAGVIGGLANAALQTFGFGMGGKAASDVAGSILNDAVSQAVQRPAVVSALGRVVYNLGAAGVQTGALGAAIETANVAAVEAAKQFSGGGFATVFNDPATRQAAVDRIADSAAQMALSLGALHGLGSISPIFSDLIRARQAPADAASVAGLMDAAAASKFRNRAPGLFEQWISRQTDGTGAENLYAPADRVAELYQSLGIEPGAGDGALGDIAPDIAQQLQQGQLTGGDVVLPTAAFVSRFADSDISRTLQPDLRVRPDGMTPREASQFEADYAAAIDARNADLLAQNEADAARVSSAEQVANEVRTQALGAGFSSDAAERYAQLYASRYATRGERLGDDPLDLFRGEGVQIQAVPPDGLPTSAPDGLDQLIAALRSGKAAPSDRAVMGPSLLEFLAQRGGIEDVDGDLRAMGADQWHRGKPGQRRLVLPKREDAGEVLPGLAARTAVENERTPDAAARAAWEAGYFPDHADRPAVNDLYEAVRSELAGEPRFSEVGLTRGQEFRNATDDLERTLARIGVDPAKATNAEIRRALEQHGEDGGAPELFQSGAREPVASIRGDEIAPGEADLKTLRSAAREFYDRELRGTSVHSAALDRDVQFRSGRKTFSASANPVKLRLFAALRDILANGHLVSSEAPRVPARESGTKAYYFIQAPVELAASAFWSASRCGRITPGTSTTITACRMSRPFPPPGKLPNSSPGSQTRGELIFSPLATDSQSRAWCLKMERRPRPPPVRVPLSKQGRPGTEARPPTTRKWSRAVMTSTWTYGSWRRKARPPNRVHRGQNPRPKPRRPASRSGAAASPSRMARRSSACLPSAISRPCCTKAGTFGLMS